MKVLVLTSTYPRWNNDTEPRFVADLCSQISKVHEVHVLAPHAPKTKKSEIIDGISVYRFRYCLQNAETLAYNGGILPNLKKSPVKVLLIPLFFIGQLIATISLLKKHNYNIIHAHWIIPQGITAACIKLLFKKKIKLITTSHGGDLFSLNGSMAKRIKQWALQQSDHITVVSQVMKEAAIKLGVNTQKISVAPMGVDLSTLFIPPTEDASRTGIIYIGRLVEKKGVRYLIEALPDILTQHPNTILTIIGDGPLLSELKQLALDHNVKHNIIFTGAIENTLIPKELQKAQIAVIPSIITNSGDQEGLGLTVIEAMGCECAVVASNLKAIQDIIPNQQYGLTTTPKDSKDIASKILTLLNNNQLSQSIAKAGRDRCLKKFDWDKAGNSYIKIIESLS